MTNQQMESALELLQEKVAGLKDRLDLMQILIDKLSIQPAPQPEQEIEKTVKVIQINMGEKRFFCKTPEEQQVFQDNNPGAKTESFNIELTPATARGFLDNPENKKQFTKKEPILVGKD
jgi:hypothetical protein